MAFNFGAFSYIVALIADAFLIFFAIFHVIAFDELKTDYKNPIDQCNSLNPVILLLVASLRIDLIWFWSYFSLFCRNISCTFRLICCSCSAASGSHYASICRSSHIIFGGKMVFDHCPKVIIHQAPLWAFPPNRYKNRPVMSGPGLYDPTNIMNADNLSKNMREGWIKLAVYLLSFFYYLYGWVLANNVPGYIEKLQNLVQARVSEFAVILHIRLTWYILYSCYEIFIYGLETSKWNIAQKSSIKFYQYFRQGC